MKGIAKAMLSCETNVIAVRHIGTTFADLFFDDALRTWRKVLLKSNGCRRLLSCHPSSETREDDDGHSHNFPHLVCLASIVGSRLPVPRAASCHTCCRVAAKCPELTSMHGRPNQQDGIVTVRTSAWLEAKPRLERIEYDGLECPFSQTETNRRVYVTSGFIPIADINLARCERATASGSANEETMSALSLLKWHLAIFAAARK